MKSIYILLSRTDTNVARIIRLISRCRFSHSSLVLDSDFSRIYSFARIKINNPLIGGFRREDLQTEVFGRCTHLPCALLELRVDDQKYKKIIKKVGVFIRGGHKKFKYNYLGLSLSFFQISHKLNKRFLCSQFIAKVLQDVGAVDFGKDISLVRPDDFLKMRQFELVYEGSLGGCKVPLDHREAVCSKPVCKKPVCDIAN